MLKRNRRHAGSTIGLDFGDRSLSLRAQRLFRGRPQAEAFAEVASDRDARTRPDVTILVDHYDEDWSRLWWIRLRGRARVLDDGEERKHALALLEQKYLQYRDEPFDGPVLAVDITEVREWAA